MLNNLRNIDGKRFIFNLKTDKDGILGRECPNDECFGYFKVKLGTGAEGEVVNLTCPYCGTKADPDNFHTTEQVEYAKSMVMREVQKALSADMKNWGKDLERSTRGGFVKIKTEFKSNPMPIHYYEEKELETTLTCEECNLTYAVFGKFAYCPECGSSNSMQIFKKNLDLVEKQLGIAETEENKEFREFLINNALEDIVSCFDSFGRNSITLATKNTSISDYSISFQNIEKAQECLKNNFNIDIFSSLSSKQTDTLVDGFQKRHLISHKDGIIDDGYLNHTTDAKAIIGRKISVQPKDVKEIAAITLMIAENLKKGLDIWKP